MDEKEFHDKIRGFVDIITKMGPGQQAKLIPLIKETEERHKQLKNDSERIEASMTSLRICLKYLMFDLEATKRERDDLKAMLEDKDDDRSG